MTNLMSKAYEELVRASTKGDKKATEELFTIGEDFFIENNPVKAAEVFKDAAIAYRIAAFRNAAQLEASQGEAKQLLEDLDIFREWLLAFPNGQIELPKSKAGLDKRFIETEFYGEHKLSSHPEIIRIYRFLSCALEKSNEDFAKINGNRPFFVYRILLSYLGIPNSLNFDLDNITVDVRVGIDLLAYAIEEKFHRQ